MDLIVTRAPLRQQQASDLVYLQSRPMAERIAAVKAIASRRGRNLPMLNCEFKGFAGLLDARGVEQLVVGEHALAAHGRMPASPAAKSSSSTARY